MIRIQKLLNRAIALNGNRITLICLKTLLEPESPLANEPTLIDARQNALDKKVREKTISNEDATLEQSQINSALQSLVDALGEGDLREDESRIMDHLVEVVELIDEERRIEEGEREDTENAAWPFPAPLVYAAIVALSVLTFAAGMFSSDSILGAEAQGENMAYEEMKAKIDSLKAQNTMALASTEKLIKTYQDSVALFRQKNQRLMEGTSSDDYENQISAKESQISSLRQTLNTKNNLLSTCQNDLANCSSPPPRPQSRACSTANAKVSLHCKSSDWESNPVRKIRTKLESVGHTVVHSSTGVGAKAKFTIEYKKGNSTARAIAHCIMEKLTNDYSLEGVSFINDSKAIDIFLP